MVSSKQSIVRSFDRCIPRARVITISFVFFLIFFFLCSVSGFTLSLAQIEVGIAYACWAALGTAIVSSAGILLFGESCDPGKLMCLTLIMTGVMGLNLLDSH
jgi:multidrug transporter EmrE-like cation transporter